MWLDLKIEFGFWAWILTDRVKSWDPLDLKTLNSDLSSENIKIQKVKMLMFTFVRNASFGDIYLLKITGSCVQLLPSMLPAYLSVAGCGCASRSSSYRCTYLSDVRSLHLIFIHITWKTSGIIKYLGWNCATLRFICATRW